MAETAIVEQRDRHIGRLVASWGAAALISLLCALLLEGNARVHGLVLAIGISVLVTFTLQISTAQRDGFITRTSLSVGGAVIIVAVIDAVFALIAG